MLGWTSGDPDAGDTVTYDVYFGTSDNPPLVSNDQSATTYDPGTLSYSTHYYGDDDWQSQQEPAPAIFIGEGRQELLQS